MQMPNGEIRKALLNSVRAAMMWTGDSDPTVERTCWGNTRKPNLAEQRATIVADKALTNFALSVIERGREAARQMSRLSHCRPSLVAATDCIASNPFSAQRWNHWHRNLTRVFVQVPPSWQRIRGIPREVSEEQHVREPSLL